MSTGRPSSGAERQARLKLQYASLYSGIVAGEWMPAWLLAEQILARAEREGVPPGERVCVPAHFEFRGGNSRPLEFKGLRTRVVDAR
jgi:hypothetical protein